MLNFNGVVLFSENPKKLIEFYGKVFASKPGWEGGEFAGFKVGSGFVTIGPHSEVKGKSKESPRIQFMFETKKVEKEFERIKGVGAKVIAKPYHPSEDTRATLATLEDPDGNFFQLVTPMEGLM